jgi:hypothetical protein
MENFLMSQIQTWTLTAVKSVSQGGRTSFPPMKKENSMIPVDVRQEDCPKGF